MKKSELVCIYPISRTSLPIVLNLQRFTSNLEPIYIIAPSSLAHINSDLGILDNRADTGFKVSCEQEFVGFLGKFDTLLIVPYLFKDPQIAQNCMNYMVQTLESGGNVICCIDLEPNNKKRVELLAHSKGGYFRYVPDENKILANLPLNPFPFCDRLNSYIIFVGSLIDNSYTLEIALTLTNMLKIQGIRATAIISESVGELFGLHSAIPRYQGAINAQMIELHRKYFVAIDQIERPDVIVIQIPNAMIQLNDQITCGLCIDTFAYSSSISPDYCICSIPFGLSHPDLVGKVSNNLYKRFGFAINCVHLSNLLVDTNISRQKRNAYGTYIDSKKAKFIYESMRMECKDLDDSIPVYNLCDINDVKEMINTQLSTGEE